MMTQSSGAAKRGKLQQAQQTVKPEACQVGQTPDTGGGQDSEAARTSGAATMHSGGDTQHQGHAQPQGPVQMPCRWPCPCQPERPPDADDHASHAAHAVNAPHAAHAVNARHAAYAVNAPHAANAAHAAHAAVLLSNEQHTALCLSYVQAELRAHFVSFYRCPAPYICAYSILCLGGVLYGDIVGIHSLIDCLPHVFDLQTVHMSSVHCCQFV